MTAPIRPCSRMEIPDREREIRDNLEAATDGPWDFGSTVVWGGKPSERIAQKVRPADSWFISCARWAVPYLLEQVDALRAENERLQQVLLSTAVVPAF